MSQFSGMIKKLQRAINEKYDQRLLYNRTQFYSEDQSRPVTMHVLKKSIFDAEKQRSRQYEIFSSTSEIQIVLFLRDYWYELNGWEVPTDNEKWQVAKNKYYQKKMDD